MTTGGRRRLLPALGGEIRVQDAGAGCVGEGGAGAGAQEGFGGQAFGEDDVVGRQFEVEVGDAAGLLLRDRGAVLQVFDGDEDAIGVDGVVGRESRSRWGRPGPKAWARMRMGRIWRNSGGRGSPGCGGRSR